MGRLDGAGCRPGDGPAVENHYTSHYLAEILRNLYFEESTGVLEVRSSDDRLSRLYFDRGMLYFAEGNDPEDQLDAALESTGLLPTVTLAKMRKLGAAPLDFASRLISGKILSREELAPCLRSLVQRAVVRAFSWPSGAWSFSEQEAVAGVLDTDILFTFECILKGITSMSHFGPLKEVLLRLPGKVRLGQRTFVPVHMLALRPHHGFVLSRVDGSLRLDEISQLMPAGEEDESLAFLYGLAVLGLVEFDPPANEGLFSLREVMQEYNEAHARERKEVELIEQTAKRFHGLRSPHEVLGISVESGLDEIQRAYDRLRAAFKKERFSQRVREKHKKDLAQIESRLAESFMRLQVTRLEKSAYAPQGTPEQPLASIDPEDLMVRREMLKSEAQATQEQNVKLGEQYFSKARDAFIEKDYHNCIQFCRQSLKYQGEVAEVYALMAESLLKNPNHRWQRMAEEALARASELDPWNPEHWVALGLFYRSRGLDHRARRHFERALEIQPTHSVATVQLKACTS